MMYLKIIVIFNYNFKSLLVAFWIGYKLKWKGTHNLKSKQLRKNHLNKLINSLDKLNDVIIKFRFSWIIETKHFDSLHFQFEKENLIS